MLNRMRRSDRELSRETAWEIVKNNRYGVLSLVCENGYPYGVPMHYAVIGDKIYFHGTSAGGMKAEAIAHCTNVSFTVIEPLEGVRCQSAIAFGKIRAVPDMRSTVLEAIIEKFVPPIAWEQAKGGIAHALERLQAYEITVEHLTGKVIDRPEGR